jgi:antitoxin component of MazEF toxin-antitoxin module
MDQAEIAKRFDHHQPTDEKIGIHMEARREYKELAHAMNDLLPESREKSLALTALEESLMWANACIARNPLE